MRENGETPERKIIPYSPSRSRHSNSDRRRKAAATKSRGICRRLSDCIIMGPAVAPRVSLGEHATKLDQLARQKVGEIDKELEKQKELKGMYKTRLEKTQHFVKHCLQVAQDNGFLDVILNKDKDKDKDEDFYNNISPTITSPQISSPSQFHSVLAPLINQAKINGWYIDPQEIELVHLSAQGTTADIYKGKWRGLHVAIKCMYPDFFNDKDGIAFFAQEVETLSRQRHPFVLHLIGACLAPPENAWILTEFFNTNLKEWLHGPGKRRKERTVKIPAMEVRVRAALEIAQAMQYLHESSPRVLHRDLKPSNIFMDDAFHVRVADFGHARFLIDGEKALTGETGTFVYMAPEVIKCGAYDEKCDVYSFGVILNELITGEYPYIQTDYGPTKIAYEVAENGLRPTTAKVDEQLEDIIELIAKSWAQDPLSRPNFSEITSILRNIDKRFIDMSVQNNII